MAIVYSARLLGYDIGLARAIGAVAFAFVIGICMAFIYGRERKEVERTEQAFVTASSHNPDDKSGGQLLVYFALLVGILVLASAKKWTLTVVFLVALGIVLYKWFSKQELWAWMKSTWDFVKLIGPWLLGGVFVAGIIRAYLPQSVIINTVGTNSILSNFIASIVGAFFYFATLTEVPIVKSFMELGMNKGPVLALLLAGPALSLPNMLVIRSIIGTKRTITYIALVVIMATAVGMIFGNLVVSY